MKILLFGRNGQVGWELQRSLSVLGPTVALVVAMVPLGCYVPSALYLAWMMRRHGGHGWLVSAAYGAAVAIAFFLVFDLWFRVPLNGSIFVLGAGTVFFILCMLGVGLFISTVSATQQQAMVTSFFFIIPAVIFSGFGSPISSMPERKKTPPSQRIAQNG